MKIVIFAGGTGSIALQQGLHQFIEHKEGADTGVDIKVITNAYDNGLSTGAVRKVMNGKILGPSDVRKNQTTYFKMVNPSSPWHQFLDHRFSVETKQAKEHCLQKIEELQKVMNHQNHQDYRFKIVLLKEAIDEYFKHPIALQIDYSDFSLANIVYAGFASANGNSLRKAASIMAKLLDIPDSVLVNDDKSLFLGAVTESGKRITDEGDIVSWGDKTDPFVDLFFTDHEGNEAWPALNSETISAIDEANLIILSSGTQWSSLIPTYASLHFKQTIEKCKAKIVMVMNRIPDQDSPGQSASDIIKILVPKYFSPGRLNVVMDSSNSSTTTQMNTLDDIATSLVNSAVSVEMGCGPGETNTKIHSPGLLAYNVLSAYFNLHTALDEISSKKFPLFMFDYDDTLVARGNVLSDISSKNIYMLNKLNSFTKAVSVCSGNSIKALNLKGDRPTSIQVYADGGVNRYVYYPPSYASYDYEYDGCVNDAAIFHARDVLEVTDALYRCHINSSKIQNRNFVSIAIKPVDEEYRQSLIKLIKHELPGYTVASTGRSTIEITKTSVSKYKAILDFLSTRKIMDSKLYYFGDETQPGGNDYAAVELSNAYNNIFCTTVSSVAETNMILKILTWKM